MARTLSILLLVAAAGAARALPAAAATPATTGGNNAAHGRDHDATAAGDPAFLSSWMARLWPAGLGNLTILDLSLPGTHDSLTSELSRTFSDRAEDLPVPLSWLLHTFGHDLGSVTAFGRNESRTQGLTLTQQLDAGIRFVDFRVIYTRPPNGTRYNATGKDWYGLHFMQTREPALAYLAELKAWLDAHPKEFVVLWVTKHGSSCAKGQYPDTPTAAKRAWWARVEALFGGLLFDRAGGAGGARQEANATTLAALARRNQRAFFYVADYADFTGSSTKAYDACVHLDNRLGSGIDGAPGRNEEAALTSELAEFSGARATKAAHKASNTFYLRSMATSSPTRQIEYAALLRYLGGLGAKGIEQKCAALYNIPNASRWCPRTLLDESQTASYYKQLSLEIAHRQGWDFPGAIYLDAVTADGAIRTGPTLLPQPPAANGEEGGSGGGGGGEGGDVPNGTAAYAYADTLVAANLRRLCGGGGSTQPGRVSSGVCAELNATLAARRARHPLRRWDDPDSGRVADWPALPPGLELS